MTYTADPLTLAREDVESLTDLRDRLTSGTATYADVDPGLSGWDRGDRAYEQVLLELEDARALVARLTFETSTGETE